MNQCENEQKREESIELAIEVLGNEQEEIGKFQTLGLSN